MYPYNMRDHGALWQNIYENKIHDSRIVRNAASILDQLIHTGMRPAPARTGHAGAAIQHVLNAQIDIVASCISGYFDSIGQGAQGGVCPAVWKENDM